MVEGRAEVIFDDNDETATFRFRKRVVDHMKGTSKQYPIEKSLNLKGIGVNALPVLLERCGL